MGGEDAPVIGQVTVTDESDQNGRAQYEVSYQVENVGDFDGEVRVQFNNSFTVFGVGVPGMDQNVSNPSVASGSVSYPDDDGSYPTVGTFDITVEVVKANGIVVDSVTVSDEPGGDGKTWPE